MAPNQPKTKNRVFRIPDDVYDPARALAAEQGETLTSVVTAALRRYVARARKDQR